MKQEVDVTKGTTGWIQTASNKRMHFLQPDPDSVDICDIAIALSRQPRYVGHGSFFYSVAQHSIYAATLAPPELRLHALLHDAHEAYTGDIPGPLKEVIGTEILRIEDRIQAAVYKGLGIGWPSPSEWDTIRTIDKSLLQPEYHALFSEHIWSINGVEPADIVIDDSWDMDFAKDMFIAYYNSIRSREGVAMEYDYDRWIEEEEKYHDEVDHGWEDNWYASFMD